MLVRFFVFFVFSSWTYIYIYIGLCACLYITVNIVAWSCDMLRHGWFSYPARFLALCVVGISPRVSRRFARFHVSRSMCKGALSHHYYANFINFSSDHVLPGWIAKRTDVYRHRHTGIVKPPSQPLVSTPEYHDLAHVDMLYRSHVLLTPPPPPLYAKYRFTHDLCSGDRERNWVTGSWMHFGRSSMS